MPDGLLREWTKGEEIGTERLEGARLIFNHDENGRDNIPFKKEKVELSNSTKREEIRANRPLGLKKGVLLTRSVATTSISKLWKAACGVHVPKMGC